MVYVSIYFCVFLTVHKALTSSASPRGGNQYFQKVNYFSLSTGGSASAGGSGPWSCTQPYFFSVPSCLQCSEMLQHSRSGCTLYICIVQYKSLPMNRSIHTAPRSTTLSALFFSQFILSHPAAINRIKSSR